MNKTHCDFSSQDKCAVKGGETQSPPKAALLKPISVHAEASVHFKDRCTTL